MEMTALEARARTHSSSQPRKIKKGKRKRVLLLLIQDHNSGKRMVQLIWWKAQSRDHQT